MKFFTSYRLITIALGVYFGAIMLLLSYAFLDGSTFNSLFINLSAGCLIISFTVVAVDFTIHKERISSNIDVINIATSYIDLAIALLLHPFSEIYDVSMSSGRVYDVNPKFIADLEKHGLKNIKKTDQEKLNKSYKFALDQALPILGNVLSTYSYALPDNIKGVILKLNENCRDIPSFLDKKEDVVNHFYIGLFSTIKELTRLNNSLRP